jgi:hypothetical protein
MRRWEQIVLGLAGIAVVIAAGLAGIAQSNDSVGHGSADPWYLAAAWVAGAVVVTLLMLFVIWPLLQTLPGLRMRILGLGSPPRAVEAPDGLEILDAMYGAEGYFENVTSAVRMEVVNGYLDMPVTTEALQCPDPRFGVLKKLTIKFRTGGRRTHTKKFTENTQAVLP